MSQKRHPLEIELSVSIELLHRSETPNVMFLQKRNLQRRLSQMKVRKSQDSNLTR